MEHKIDKDLSYMKVAIQLAEMALEEDEVPVGAVVVHQGKIIAKGYNLCEKLIDPTAHAEMQVLTAACNYMNSKILEGCDLYVSLEPCPMCAEAIFLSRPSRLIYSATDPKRGYNSVFNFSLHPSTKAQAGIMKIESAILLRRFFLSKR